MRLLLALPILSACTASPYVGLGADDPVAIEVEGWPLIVQQDPRNPNQWAASMVVSKRPLGLYDPATKARVSRAAIETVSGCEVMSLTPSPPSPAMWAEVDC